MKNVFFLFFILMCFFACKKSVQNQDTEKIVKKPDLSIAKEHGGFTDLDSVSSKQLQDWEEYQTFKNFITRFKKTSANEALSNALELKTLIDSLKLKKMPEILNTPSFKARLNVLDSEILRLVDMTYIPAITSDEVNNQIIKILNLYSTTNEKINTVFLRQQIENEINKTPDTLTITKSIK